MKPKDIELKDKKYQVERVETRAYVYYVKAKNEDEALEKVQQGEGVRHKELDFTVEVFYQSEGELR